ncbi:EAL domain-containing protein [Limisalsivibrio acetivorans]|uniref:EAL domain-containing protein n=1 Tax=Limisalsivibrio acetivorans TaxID=1304888 RepID=UPI0003B5EA52|nr:EAL domain-containing protein [Limisalsivibrio acetivorans]
MDNCLRLISEEFTAQLNGNKYFSAFLNGENISIVTEKVYMFLDRALSSEFDESLREQAFNIGARHYHLDIPLLHVIEFLEHIEDNLAYSIENPNGMMCSYNLDNFGAIKSEISKAYLFEQVQNADFYNISLFTVYSTTNIVTSTISWMMDVNNRILSGDLEKGPELSHNACILSGHFSKPYFRMIFNRTDDERRFHEMHTGLHSTANSLFYFYDNQDYNKTYLLYCDLLEQCNSLLSFFYERILLFEQNKKNILLSLVEDKLSEGEDISLICLNVRNMAVINDVWGQENGDFVLNEVESVVDKIYGIYNENATYIRTSEGLFYIAVFAPRTEAQDSFERFAGLIDGMSVTKELLEINLRFICVFLPLSDSDSDYKGNLAYLTKQLLNKCKDDNEWKMLYERSDIEEQVARIEEKKRNNHYIIQSFDADKIFPFYHTIFSSKTGEVEHVEVLARVCDDKTCMNAGIFIDYLIATDRITELDRKILHRVAEDLEVLGEHVNRVFINMNPKSLQSDDYLKTFEWFNRLAREKEVEAVFEITEQALFRNVNIVRALHMKYGVKFAIDDFGTGYSNFNIVSEMARNELINYIKIDGSLIKNILESPEGFHIVEGISSIAQKLNLKTVAEFVANREILETIRRVGIDNAQGFYLSQPAPLEKLTFEGKL